MRVYQTQFTGKAESYIYCNFKMSMEQIQSWVVFGKIRFRGEVQKNYT